MVGPECTGQLPVGRDPTGRSGILPVGRELTCTVQVGPEWTSMVDHGVAVKVTDPWGSGHCYRPMG